VSTHVASANRPRSRLRREPQRMLFSAPTPDASLFEERNSPEPATPLGAVSTVSLRVFRTSKVRLLANERSCWSPTPPPLPQRSRWLLVARDARQARSPRTATSPRRVELQRHLGPIRSFDTCLIREAPEAARAHASARVDLPAAGRMSFSAFSMACYAGTHTPSSAIRACAASARRASRS
jgi:hypothetical protein